MSNTKAEYGIRIEPETLTDGSMVYNVKLVSEEGVIVFRANDERASRRLATQLRNTIEINTPAEVDDLNA